MVDAFNKYYIANIPVDYWFRDMNDFNGSKALSRRYEAMTEDIELSYAEGLKSCFAGSHGVGKTYTCACILKRVAESGKYNALYVNLTDIINVLLSENKEVGRRLLLERDFLVIDEFDSRFMGTSNSADLFGRIIEPVIRTRIQNRLPLLICTNSPDLTEGFSGPLQASIKSLMKVVKLTPALGKDYRGEIDE